MAPFVMAFARPEPGQPHPAPWKPAKGGFAFDITSQIHIPRKFSTEQWFDRLNTIWWFVALLRFRATPYITVPVVASMSFSEAAKSKEEIHFWPVEVEPRRLRIEKNSAHEIREQDLAWIKANWWNAGKLMRVATEFNLLFRACDQCTFTTNPPLALLSLWGALEGLFSAAKAELRFRVSASIAAFLESPGPGRLELQKKVAKLYDARSQVAHGGLDLPEDALADSYSLTKRVITKVIEDNHVPSRDDLEKALFSARTSDA